MHQSEFAMKTWQQLIGQQPVSAEQGAGNEPMRRARGVYIHVPYCVTRCGYCDFNTYTPGEVDVATRDYAKAARREIRHAGEMWQPGSIDTVFFGGGTPTMLDAKDLLEILETVKDTFGLAEDVEVTVEANPDSVDQGKLESLRSGGITRVSMGVQSLSPRVLDVLDRTHTPGRAVAAIADARAAGFEHVSADIIYATPGESDDDLVGTLEGLFESGIDHLSAYSLIVEPGTRLAARVKRGDVPPVDDDVAAHRYGLVEKYAQQSGMQWYEVSNWSLPGGECRHNLGYWQGGEWWAVGPGAHGYVGTVRWWNVKHPAAYLDQIAASGTAVAGFEEIDEATARLEHIMLALRVREGVSMSHLSESRRPAVLALTREGLLEAVSGQLVLTDRGRLFADAVIRDIT